MNEHVSLTPDRGCRQTGDPGAGRDGAECRKITKKDSPWKWSHAQQWESTRHFLHTQTIHMHYFN